MSARILAVDPGTRRLGIALSDPLGLIASPHSVISFRKLEPALEEVAELARREDAGLILVGLPLGMDGRESDSTRHARQVAARLRELTGLEVIEWDERLTTRDASCAMREGGVDSRGQRGRVDMVAAALILQRYLER